jgi:hypothetical protein
MKQSIARYAALDVTGRWQSRMSLILPPHNFHHLDADYLDQPALPSAVEKQLDHSAACKESTAAPAGSFVTEAEQLRMENLRENFG